MLLSDVCRLSVAYIERPRKTKIGTEITHVTRDSDTISRSKGQRSRSPDRFTQRGLNAYGGCSGQRAWERIRHGKVLLRCVCSAARDREERGGGILCRHAHSLFLHNLGMGKLVPGLVLVLCWKSHVGGKVIMSFH